MTDRNTIMNMVRDLAECMPLFSADHAGALFEAIELEIALLEEQSQTSSPLVIMNQSQLNIMNEIWGDVSYDDESVLGVFNKGGDLCVCDPAWPEEGYVIITEHAVSESQAFDNMIDFLMYNETKFPKEADTADVREAGEICLLWEVCQNAEA